MNTEETPTEIKLFIKSLLDKSFTAALKKSPGGERLLLNLSEEIEKNLFDVMKHIIETEKRQLDYYQQLIHFAKLVDFKGEMLQELKQRLREKN